MLIQDIMRYPVITATPDTSIREVMALMFKHRIRHVPIVDGGGELVGIVTDRDVREAGPSRIRHDEEDFRVFDEPVQTIMKRDVITSHPHEFVEEAAFIMKQYRIGSLPVLSRRDIVGIVTDSDLLGALVELMGVDQPSSRLEIEVVDRTGILADMTAIIKALGISITSFFVYKGARPGYRRVALRVRTMDPRKLIEHLIAAGFEVIWPRLEDL